MLMAKPDLHAFVLLFMLFLVIQRAEHLQLSQSQTLLSIQKLFGYPQALSTLQATEDMCNIEPTPAFTISCYEDNLTQLHIISNNDIPILPQGISSFSLFSTLAGLPGLKVLSLVSLRIWGPLPESLGQMRSLEILNISSNYFDGMIPSQLSFPRSLQTVILDNNKFTGQIPSWLGSLPRLAVLCMNNNFFNGTLPESFSSSLTLRVLSLSRNFLSGDLPNLHNLTNLQILDLEDNNFGPHVPSLPTKLISIVLRNNSFRSQIPSELSSCYQLQKLDVSLNKFVGPFSPSILALPSINYIDISENKFAGMLSRNMSCSDKLAFVNISANLLKGQLPSCLESKSRVVIYARNCLSSSDKEQYPSAFCQNEALAVNIKPYRNENKKSRGNAILVSSAVGGILGGITFVGLVFVFIRKNNHKGSKKPPVRSIIEHVSTANTAKLLTDARHISQTMKMGASLPAYRAYALEELKEATHNFDASYSLSDDSHSQIYKGKLFDGTEVVIRSFTMKKRCSPQTYLNHIELISRLRHSHLASALGHCFECYPDDSNVKSIYLVFEFVPNGTLRGCISGLEEEKLSWTQRIAAAIGVTKGIRFLHTGTVHGLCSNNLRITDILLDNDLNVKISTYNLPVLAENTRMTDAGISALRLKGSVRTRDKTIDGVKNDVYDIGVILLEIVLGRPVIFHNEVGGLKDIVQMSLKGDEMARRSILDPTVQRECSDESLKTFMDICVRCLSNEPEERPSVEDVLWNLQYAAQVQSSCRRDSNDNQGSPMSSSP